MGKSKKHGCHNAKCGKKLVGNFICMNYGGTLEQSDGSFVASDKIECHFDIMTHSVGDGPFGSVDLHKKAQHNYASQGESYFCSKQCLIDWFTRKLKDLPEPGTETQEIQHG